MRVEAESTKAGITLFEEFTDFCKGFNSFDISFVVTPVRIEDDKDVKALEEEFKESAKADEPAVEEKPLNFNPTNEEYDAAPDPEFKPSPDAVAVEDRILKGAR